MVLLSFDFEEFDVPREHGVEISLDRSMDVSVEGAERVLSVLESRGVKATFFCTATFAINAPDVMDRIIAGGHEVASHGYDHSKLSADDAARSKTVLEELYGIRVVGYRQPRMASVSKEALLKAGYRYDSSLNPTFIPGRYMHLSTPRTWFRDADGLLQVPVSVSPTLRLPLFWLSLHHFPEQLYYWLAARTLRKDGYLLTYFHPWEFAEATTDRQWKLPYVVRHRCGVTMADRLGRFIDWLQERGEAFTTISTYFDLQDTHDTNK